MPNSKTTDPPTKSTDDDAKIRRFLVYSLTGLMFASLLTYLVTRNGVVLIATFIFATAHTIVYPYYFPRRRT